MRCSDTSSMHRHRVSQWAVTAASQAVTPSIDTSMLSHWAGRRGVTPLVVLALQTATHGHVLPVRAFVLLCAALTGACHVPCCRAEALCSSLHIRGAAVNNCSSSSLEATTHWPANGWRHVHSDGGCGTQARTLNQFCAGTCCGPIKRKPYV
ncbi:hypothetical protein COO60DRAFT_719395 [Scenedesmus sp. NREL 46B-D3]|nr:hypothetical protein COO60DRAFT_719395 [Scenedesmus sp. NREL 46B-D3]